MKELNYDSIKKSLSRIGIYKIVINNKDYIGSSCNIGYRLKHHLWTMQKGTHHNRTMQNLYNKYKVVFFEVVEECSIDILLEKEKFYIDLLNPYINHILDPVCIKRDETYKKRLSDSLKKLYASGKEVVNKKEVHMYDLKGKYIKSFNSITDASKTILNTNQATAISAVCRGVVYTAGKYRWSYKKQDLLEPFEKKYNKYPVYQYTLLGELIKKWPSAKDAQRELKISNIARAIKYNLTAGGFKWQKSDSPPKIL